MDMSKGRKGKNRDRDKVRNKGNGSLQAAVCTGKIIKELSKINS